MDASISVDDTPTARALAAAFENLPGVALIVSRDAEIVAVNRTARAAGLSAGDNGTKRKLNDFFDCDEQRIGSEIRAAASGELLTLRQCAPTPAENPLSFSVSPIRSDAERVSFFVLLQDRSDTARRAFFEMSAELRAVNEAAAKERSRIRLLEEQQKELEAVNTQLEAINFEFQRSNQDLDRFASIVSHDLKEPVRGIGINAKFLLRDELSEEAARRVSRIVVLCDHMNNLISDILSQASVERSDALELRTAPGPVIQQIEKDLEEVMLERGASIVILNDLPEIAARRGQVKIVFLNLILNGVKHNNALEKRIEIGFKESVALNNRVMRSVFFVKDNGVGLNRTKFQEALRANKPAPGKAQDFSENGAGLFIVKRIVEEAGGEIDFEILAEGGTVFYAALPVPPRDAAPTTNSAEKETP